MSRPSTPQYDFEDREMVKVYAEVDVAVDVMDPKTKDTVYFTVGADWAFGYSGRQASEQRDKEINTCDGEICSMVYSPNLADREEEIEATPQMELDD